MLFERGGARQVIELARHLGLLLQLFEVGVELAQDVLNAGEILAGVGQAVLGLSAALLVLGDASGFFQKQAEFLRFGFDDAADSALTDDGVSAWPQARAQKHVLHVPAAHWLVVDVVAAGAIAGQHPLDGNLAKGGPLPARAVVGVIKHQFHTGAAGGLAGGGAIENDILHRLAAQLRGLGLAQHPAHRIHDVGLAAAVRPDHTHQLPREHEGGGLGE